MPWATLLSADTRCKLGAVSASAGKQCALGPSRRVSLALPSFGFVVNDPNSHCAEVVVSLARPRYDNDTDASLVHREAVLQRLVVRCLRKMTPSLRGASLPRA